MKIYIMRHGEAGYSALSDSKRALTEHGINQSKQVGHWLNEQHIQFDLGLVSPYLRAQQTLEHLASAVSIAQIETNNGLVPGGCAAHIVDMLTLLPLSGIKNTLIVSHLPLVGYLVNELCRHVPPPMFATASVACIQLSSDGAGTLEWLHQME